MTDEIKLYAVRNSEGKWKGYGGYGETWTDRFSAARIYNKIEHARAQVTYFAKNYPQYGIPELVELTITRIEVLDETERVAKALGK